MITREQAEKVTDTLLEPHQDELQERKKERQEFRTIQQRRRESPLVPAIGAAVATYILLSYVDSAIFVVTVGAGVGGLFGWVARKM